MPTEAKRQAVAELAELIKGSTVAIATDFSGLSASHLTELRHRLREHSAQYRVVKNRLALLAAQEAGQEPFTHLLQRCTGIIFGHGEATATAKALDEFVKATRSTLVVRNGFMDGRLLTEQQVATLATLPSKDELISRFLGQLQAPIAGLLRVLTGPVQGLTILLQRRADQLADQSG